MDQAHLEWVKKTNVNGIYINFHLLRGWNYKFAQNLFIFMVLFIVLLIYSLITFMKTGNGIVHLKNPLAIFVCWMINICCNT